MRYKTKDLPVVEVINLLDKFLESIGIVPVLEYKTIKYKLTDNNGKPLLTIQLKEHELEYIWDCGVLQRAKHAELETMLQELIGRYLTDQ